MIRFFKNFLFKNGQERLYSGFGKKVQDMIEI